MATREYRFIVGPETDTLPTAGTPTVAADVLTLGFADTRYSGARHVSTFNATTDWGSPAGGYYSITVTAATHGKGTTPQIQEYVLTGSDYVRTQAETSKFDASGNITLMVPQVPDSRFAGKLIVL